ncbi:hypothetical protein [Nicoliella lavandulae]|uniref:Uncharacterized protein n=1 Tax=Nicoliella lavandulae TaxID=3082954 RepID=A0ABU8SNL1_9LACO
MEPEQSALAKVKSLLNKAEQDPATRNYYTEEINLYIRFLELWDNKDNRDQFSPSDQELITAYINALNTKLLPEYQAALNDFDEDLNLQNVELLHLTPKDNKANLSEYVTLRQYFNNQITPNAIIDDINNIDEPVNTLIERDELPKYAAKLDWLALDLLINAIAFKHWFNH